MSIVEEYVRSLKDMFTDGRTKKCKEAGKKYHELVSGATDEELQEIVDQVGGDIEEIKDRRKRFRETLDKSEK